VTHYCCPGLILYTKDGKVLLEDRERINKHGEHWSFFGGSLKEGETKEQALVREIKEETGLVIPAAELKYFTKVFVRYPDKDFIYHMFSLKLVDLPDIKLSDGEHQQYQWVRPVQALEWPLILDEDSCLKMFYKI